MKHFTFYTLLIAFGFLQSNISIGQDTAVEMKVINDPAYSLSYPVNWDINKTSDLGINLIAIAPMDSKEDRYRENLTLVLQDVSGDDLNVEKFGQSSSRQIIASMVNAESKVGEMASANGLDFYHAVYSGEQNGYNITYEQRYFVKDNRAYVFTLSSEVVSQAKYEVIFNQILDSFKFED